MGITNESFALYRKLHNEKHIDFKQPIRVLEIGSQNVHISGFDYVTDCIKSFGFDDSVCKDFRHNMYMRNVHTALGHTYDSFDLDTADNQTIEIDLNQPVNMLNREMFNVCDLVTNHGTTEHLFNQSAVFETMHDACKVGGIMVHVLPCIEPNHGLFCYSPVLFEALANYNDYELLVLSVMDPPNNNTSPSFYRSYNEADIKKNCYVYAALKKTQAKDFEQPSQVFKGGRK